MTTATMGGEPLVKKSLLDAANAEIATLKTRLSAVEANTKDLEAKTLRVSTVTNAAAGTRHASKNFCLNFFGLFLNARRRVFILFKRQNWLFAFAVGIML